MKTAFEECLEIANNNYAEIILNRTRTLKPFHSLIMTVDEALLTEIAYSSKIQPSTEELMKLFGMWGEALNDFCSKQTGKTLIQCMTFAIDPANNK